MQHGGRVAFVTIALALAGCGDSLVPDPYRVATFEGEADSVSCLPAGDGTLVVASEAAIGGSGRVSLFDTESYELTELAGASARFIALDGDFLIAGNRPGAFQTVPLFRVPLAGGELERIPDREGVWSLATDGGAYFWHQRGSTGGIYRFDPGDESLALLVATDEVRGDLVVSNGWLYWAERQRVRRMPTGGGTAETLLDHVSEPTEMERPIAVDESYLYIGMDSATNTRLVAVPLAGGAAVDVASLLPRLPTAVAARDGFVYWATGEPNRYVPSRGMVSVSRRHRDGGPIEVLAERQNGVSAIVPLEGRVFWCDWLANSISMTTVM